MLKITLIVVCSTILIACTKNDTSVLPKNKELKIPETDCPQAVPDSTCSCSTVVDFVCGCNQLTYINSCEAECNGIIKYTQGPCK